MNILITGASKGIGKETALALAANPAHHLILISRDAAMLESIKRVCEERKYASTLNIFPVDLHDINEKAIFSTLSKDISHLDILINNAGYLIRKAFEETSLEEAKKVFETNLFGAAELIKQLLPLLKKSKHAHVVNISSMAGFQGSIKFSGLAYYSASKSALATLTECLAQEYKEQNIKFNCLALGAVQTEMMAEAFPGYKAPLKAEEMGCFIADFAINGNKYFNGRIIPVSVSTP